MVYLFDILNIYVTRKYAGATKDGPDKDLESKSGQNKEHEKLIEEFMQLITLVPEESAMYWIIKMAHTDKDVTKQKKLISILRNEISHIHALTNVGWDNLVEESSFHRNHSNQTSQISQDEENENIIVKTFTKKKGDSDDIFGLPKSSREEFEFTI